MNFSLIFPTLGDMLLNKRFFDSLEKNTKYKDKIEVLVAIDEGETAIVGFIEDQNYSFSIKFYERPITDNFSDDYYNWLAKQTIGKNIWAINDDVQFVTKHWDKKILKKISEYGWSIYLIDTTDSTRGRINKDFCCFPLIGRKHLDALGFLFYKQVRIYPADKVIYQLYQEVGRIINARDIILKSTYVEESKNTRLWNIYQEDLKSGALNVNITRELFILLKIGSEERPKGGTKLQRILNIIKEK